MMVHCMLYHWRSLREYPIQHPEVVLELLEGSLVIRIIANNHFSK
jgi:hypothetical protein